MTVLTFSVFFQIMDLTSFSSIFVSFSILFLSLKLIQHKLSKSRDVGSSKCPPGPWKLPIIRSIHHLALPGSLPHRALRDLSRKHGPIMHLQLGERSTVLISGAGMAKKVFTTHDIAFANRPKLLAGEIIMYNCRDIAFAPNGDYWRQMRKICVLELLSVKNVHGFGFIPEDESWNMIRSIQPSPAKVNLTEKAFALTNFVTCRAAFGSRCKHQDELIRLTNRTAEIGSGFEIADFFPLKKKIHVLSGTTFKLKKLSRNLDKILDEIIQEQEKKLATSDSNNQFSRVEDLVDVLLKNSKRGGLDFPISNDTIKAVIADMFMAGTETSAVTILWVMSELIRNPGVMDIAQAEVRRIFHGKSRIGDEDLKGLSYLKLVIKETLRLHPPIPLLLPRESRENCEIEGYNIPIGTNIIANAWAVNRDPEFWNDVEAFEPGRFLNNAIEIIGSNFEYIPFRGGRRMCPGISFGLATVELALAQLLDHFDWKIPGGMKPELLDMTEIFGASVKRENSLCLAAITRFPFAQESMHKYCCICKSKVKINYM